MSLLFLSGAIVAGTIATASLEASAGFTRPWPSLLSLTLQKTPIGIAYAIWSGVGIVLISLLGRALIGQAPYLPDVVAH